jgi:hypothetical protein
MAWTLVKTSGPFNPSFASSPATNAFSSGVTAGNLIIVGVNYLNGAALTVKDNLGNSLTQIVSEGDPANSYLASIWYEIAPAGVTSITMTWSGTNGVGGWWQQEYSTPGGTVSVDKTNQNQGVGTAITSLSTGTLSSASELVLNYISTDFGVTSGESGWTLLNDQANSGSAFQTLVVSATTAQTGTATQSSSGNWASVIATFQASGGGSINPTVSGTISVSGVVTPTISGISESISGNIAVTGAPNVQLAFQPSLLGAVSVSGVVTPTFGNVNVNISGSVDVTGIFTPSLGIANTGSVNVTGIVNPTLSGGGTQPVTVSGTLQISGSISITLSGPTPPAPPPGNPPLFIGQLGRFDVIANAIIRRDPTTIVQEASTGNYYFLRDILDPLLVSTQDPTYNPGLRFAYMEWLQDQGTISWVTPTGSRQLLYTIITTMQWQNGFWVPK